MIHHINAPLKSPLPMGKIAKNRGRFHKTASLVYQGKRHFSRRIVFSSHQPWVRFGSLLALTGYISQIACQFLVVSGLWLAQSRSLKATEKEGSIQTSNKGSNQQSEDRSNKDTKPADQTGENSLSSGVSEEFYKEDAKHPLTQAFWKTKDLAGRLQILGSNIEKLRNSMEHKGFLTKKVEDFKKEDWSDYLKVFEECVGKKYEEIFACSQCVTTPAKELKDAHYNKEEFLSIGELKSDAPKGLSGNDVRILFLTPQTSDSHPSNFVAMKKFTNMQEKPHKVEEGLKELLDSLFAYKANPDPSKLKMTRIYDAVLCPQNSLTLIMEGANTADIHHFLATPSAENAVKACAQYLAMFHIENHRKISNKDNRINIDDYIKHKIEAFMKISPNPLEAGGINLAISEYNPDLEEVTKENIIQLLQLDGQEKVKKLVHINRKNFRKNCKEIFRSLKSDPEKKPPFYFLTKTHGDAHGNNFFYSNDERSKNEEPFKRISMIDFASIIRTYNGIGDPAEDVGRFLGSLWDWAAKSETPVDKTHEKIYNLQNSFLDSYLHEIKINNIISNLIYNNENFQKIFKENWNFYKLRFYSAIFNNRQKNRITKENILKSWMQEKDNQNLLQNSASKKNIIGVPERPKGFIVSSDQKNQNGKSYLHQLWEKFIVDWTKKTTVFSTIAGVGGIGKTSLALQYVYEALDYEEYDTICWLYSETTPSLLKGYRDFLDEMGVSIKNESEDEIVKIFKEQISLLKGECLLIYDNVPNTEFLAKMPTGDNVDILITSRCSEGWENQNTINLDHFCPKDSVHYLRQTICPNDDSKDFKINELAETLWHYPLALSHAAHYIAHYNEFVGDNNKKINITDIIQEYIDSFNFIKKESRGQADPSDKPKKMPFYENLVRQTYEISIHKISDLAKQIIVYCSYLDPDAIAEKIFMEGLENKENDIQKAFEQLSLISLIKKRQNESFLSIHRFLQHVIREKNNKGDIENGLYSIFNHIYQKKPSISEISYYKITDLYRYYNNFFLNMGVCIQNLSNTNTLNLSPINQNYGDLQKQTKEYLTSLKNKIFQSFNQIPENRQEEDNILNILQKDLRHDGKDIKDIEDLKGLLRLVPWGLVNKRVQLDIIDIFLKLPKTEKGDFVAFVNQLAIPNTVTGYARTYIITALAKIEPSQRQTFIDSAKHLITDKMGGYERVSIIEALAKIESNHRQAVSNSAKQLIMPDMRIDGIISIIEAFAKIDADQRQGVVESVRQVITLNMKIDGIISIIEAFAKVDASEHQEVINIVRDLSALTKRSERPSIIEAFAKVDTDQRQGVVESINPLIKSTITGNAIAFIISILGKIKLGERGIVIESIKNVEPSWLRGVMETANQLILPNMRGDLASSIIAALGRITPDQRGDVAVSAKEVITPNMRRDTADSIIAALGRIRLDQRKDVAVSAKEVITSNMRGDTADSIIAALSRVTNGHRKDVAVSAKEVISSKMCGDTAGSIIEVLGKMNQKHRMELAKNAKEVITLRMRGSTAGSIIEVLGKMNQKHQMEVIESAKQLITPDIEDNTRAYIIEAFGEITADERKSFLESAKLLLKPNMNKNKQRCIIESLKKVGFSQRQEIAKSAKILLTPSISMSEEDQSLIIETFAKASESEWQTIAESMKLLLCENICKRNQYPIIDALIKIPFSQRVGISQSTRLLLIPDMEGYALAQMIKTFNKIPEDRRQKIAEKARLWGSRDMTGYDQTRIIEYLSKIDDSQWDDVAEKAKPLLYSLSSTETMKYEQVSILEALGRVDPAKREEVVKSAQELINNITGREALSSIIEDLGRVPQSQMQEVVEKNKQKFVQGMKDQQAPTDECLDSHQSRVVIDLNMKGSESKNLATEMALPPLCQNIKQDQDIRAEVNVLQNEHYLIPFNVIKKIKSDQQGNFRENLKLLIPRNMEGHNHHFIIESFRKVKGYHDSCEKWDNVAVSANLLMTPNMSGQERAYIIKAFGKLNIGEEWEIAHQVRDLKLFDINGRALGSIIKSFGKIRADLRKKFIENTKILVDYSMSGYEQASIIQALEKVNPIQWEDVSKDQYTCLNGYEKSLIIRAFGVEDIESTKQLLLTDNISEYQQYLIVKALGKVSPSKWPEIAENTRYLLAGNINEHLKVSIIKALGQIEINHQQKFVENVKQLLPSRMEGDKQAVIIQSLAEIEESKRLDLAKDAKPFLNENMIADGQALIIRVLGELDIFRRKKVIQIAKQLFVNQMSPEEKWLTIKILGNFCLSDYSIAKEQEVDQLLTTYINQYIGIAPFEGKIDAEQQKKILETTKKLLIREMEKYKYQGGGTSAKGLIMNNTGSDKRVSINGALAKIPQEQRNEVLAIAKELIIPGMKEDVLGFIITALGKLEAKQRSEVVASTKRLIANDMSSAKIASIIDALGKIEPGQRKEVAAIAKELTTPDMRENAPGSIITALGKLEAKQRSGIAASTKRLIANDMSSGKIVSIIDALGKIEPGQKNEVAAIAKELITPDMREDAPGSIITALGKLEDKQFSKVAAIAKELVTSSMGRDVQGLIIEALGKIKPGQRKEVAAIAKNIIKPGIGEDALGSIITALGKIEPSQRKEVTAIAKKVIKPGIGGNIPGSILIAFWKIQAKERHRVAKIAKLLLIPNVDGQVYMDMWRNADSIIANLGKMNDAQRKEFVTKIKQSTSPLHCTNIIKELKSFATSQNQQSGKTTIIRTAIGTGENIKSSAIDTRFVIDLGSSGVQLGGFKINIDKGIIEEETFNKKERILLQAGIQNRILPKNLQIQTIDAIKKLLSEAKVDPQNTKVIGYATAWARAADNSDKLIEAIKSETGVTINIIDQQTEGKIGYNATLAQLRSLTSNKQSFLYQTEDGKEIRLKITGNNRDEDVIPETVISWDIGGGSMQLARQSKNKTIDVIGSTDSSTTFANAVIDLKKDWSGENINAPESRHDTPNPLSESQTKKVIRFAIEKAEKFVSGSFLESLRSKNSEIFGIGLMHKSNRLYINKLLGMNWNNFYVRSDLEKAAELLVGKKDGEIANALGIKESDARNRFTSMLLVLGFMKHFEVNKINTIDVTSITGVLFTDKLCFTGKNEKSPTPPLFLETKPSQTYHDSTFSNQLKSFPNQLNSQASGQRTSAFINKETNADEQNESQKIEKISIATDQNMPNTIPEVDTLQPSQFETLDIPLRKNEDGLLIRNKPLNVDGGPQEAHIIDGKYFRRQNVSGASMRCFFNAVGLEPDIEIAKLNSKQEDPIVRYMIADEIVSAAANPEQLPKSVKDAINYDLYALQRGELDKLEEKRSNILTSQNPDVNQQNLNALPPVFQQIGLQGEDILADLRKRSLSLNAFCAFLKDHIGSEQMMVALHDVQGDGPGNTSSNYTSIDAIAYVNNLGLKVYQPNEKNDGLNLVHQFIPQEATEIVYLYHQGSHFQALILG